MAHTPLELPDGRTLQVSIEARDRLSCGVLVFEPVRVFDNPAVKAATEALGARLQEKHAGLKPSQIPGLEEARDLYKSFSMEPTRYRPSSEALLRRVVAGKGLYTINNAVDTCNLACLEFLLPVGMYDLDRVQGAVTLRTGQAGESYPGIRKGEVNLQERLGLFDATGPFGSPTSDSARTCVTDDTRRILAVIMATATYGAESMTEAMEIFSGHFTAFCEAREVFRGRLGRD